MQPFYFPREHPLTETLVVSCIAARGTPPLVFSWLKDDRPVNSAHGVVSKMITESISTLAIPRVGAEHLGNYTCRAENDVGSDSYTSTLVVAGQWRIFLDINIHLTARILLPSCTDYWRACMLEKDRTSCQLACYSVYRPGIEVCFDRQRHLLKNSRNSQTTRSRNHWTRSRAQTSEHPAEL